MKTMDQLSTILGRSLGLPEAQRHVRQGYQRLVEALAVQLPVDARAAFFAECAEHDISQAGLDALAAEEPGSVDPEPTVMVESPRCICGHQLAQHRPIYEQIGTAPDGVIDLASTPGVTLCLSPGCRACWPGGFRLQ